MEDHLVIVAGMGEIGRPLLKLLARSYDCVAVDIEPVTVSRPCAVLHVCYPYQIADFVGVTASYIEKYNPDLTIINSTVAPGTTHAVYRRSMRPVAYSPVRGKHAAMERDLMYYRKFVAGIDARTTARAGDHFARAGFKTDEFRSPEIGEISKLLETTWVGILVAWAQEVERIGADYGASYDDVNAFMKEIAFVPSHVFPGPIGGHCVMPNIDILRAIRSSGFLDFVVASNQEKQREMNLVAKE